MASTKPLRILMLHGFTQSGSLFRAKTRSLEKQLLKAFPQGVSLVYPTGPIKLSHNDIPTWDSNGNVISRPLPDDNAEVGLQGDEDDLDAWSWWRIRVRVDPYVYEDTDVGYRRIAQVLTDMGPFDGIMGFSQGAGMAAMVASLLEEGRVDAFKRFEEVYREPKKWTPYAVRGEQWKDLKFEPVRYPKVFLDEQGKQIHPPFKFAACYSGFAAPHPMYTAYYWPKIQTPVVHFIGTLDTVVKEEASLALHQFCEDSRVVYHPGGHYVPANSKEIVGALIEFIRDKTQPKQPSSKNEERVEDMELPF